MPSKPRQFSPRPAKPKSEVDRQFDAQRGSARQRGYGARWDAASAGFKRQHPLCIGCEAVGLIAATEVTDHVVPHKGDRVIFWDRKRWQPACGRHHDVVKQRLEAMFMRGQIDESQLWVNSVTAIRLTLEAFNIEAQG